MIFNKSKRQRTKLQPNRFRKSRCLLTGCLLNVPATAASVSQGRICSDNFTCCHTEIEVADPTFHLTQSQYIDTGPSRSKRQHTKLQPNRFRKSRCLLIGCLLNVSATAASVSQGRICSDNFTCRHTEIEVADPTFHLSQSQYIDTRPSSPSTDPITLGAWQGSHWSANF